MTSGRSGTGHRTYRRNRELVLANSDLCGLCGHHGSRTADHKIPDRLWPRGPDGKRLPGFNDIGNLQPAHGTMGAGRNVVQNRCPVCKQLCNQSKGDGRSRGGRRRAARPSTRDWLGSG